MSDKKKDIISKDSGLDPIVYDILNEAYHEFRQMYGDKHSDHIKKIIESITDKVEKNILYYFAPIATAHAQNGVRYTETDQLPAVLKHEMWHIYNNSASDIKKSLQHIPQRYLAQLQQNGYLEKLYTKKMEDYKKRWKDAPERLKDLLTDFETFVNSRFDFEDSPVEMWTEWFNSQTHLKDMQENFWDWGDGYFTKSLSSGSFYDSYINIASMISCIIPKEKLLEMYLQTGEYQTDYSYPEMLEEFDEKYANSLNSEESEKYKYPYLKIIMDTKMVSDNAKKNPSVALTALQSCMKTCFNAYLQKMESIENIDFEQAKKIYSEIKYMQEQMVWNTDISKMQDLDYIQAMSKIQDKFKSMLQELDLENPEVMQMLENIDYTADNPFKFVEDGEKISRKIISTQRENKTNLISIDGNYKVHVGKNGIKDNLYSTLFALLGNRKYNLLYEKFQDNDGENSKENILLKFHKQIEEATTDEDFINIYNSIYGLYAKKLEDTLKINENIESKFIKYSKEIVELQKNGLFDEKNKMYLLGLEQIIDIYNKKVQAYEQEIDKITENEIQRRLKEGITRKEAESFSQRIPNMCKNKLSEQQGRISTQRENQVLQYMECYKTTYSISTQQIGVTTINVPTSEKKEAAGIEQSGLLGEKEEHK